MVKDGAVAVAVAMRRRRVMTGQVASAIAVGSTDVLHFAVAGRDVLPDGVHQLFHEIKD